ncbi:hypothetical protein AB6F89_06360 [Providencia hangzhouensis]|uniref:hypothetical protein n=1 Tax=Providencia hangzhouensis TaxID=3031799 RepID=UPI0034DD4308
MATLIDTLLVSLKLDSASFAADAKKATNENDRLSKSIDSLNDVLGDVNETLKGTKEQQKKAKEQADEFTKSINNGVKALATLFSTILVSTGLQKLIDDTAKANDQLNFMSKNLGVNATTVKRWQGAAEMAGGSADGMAASMGGLSKSLWDMVTMGDTSVLPYFNALNVGVMKNNGELRNLDDILLDVSDSLSKMSRPQAYNFAKNMGFDEGTINMLLQGRDALEQQLASQKDIIVSSEQELEISRQLRQQNSLINLQWEGLKTLIANYLMPYALKFSEVVSGFLNYLNKNRDTAVMVFKAMGAVIGLTLIPLALKAGAAFMGMFAPLFGGVGLVLLLAAAIAALYDDYKTWKEGGKSLFDWEEWDGSITFILKKLDELETWFKDTTIGKWFTDQNGDIEGWKLALTGVGAYIGGKWAFGIIGALLRIGGVFKGLINMPTMLLAATAYALNEYRKYLDSLDLTAVTDKLSEGLVSVGKTYHAVNVLKGDSTSEEKIKATRQAAGDYVPSLGAINTVIDSGLADKIVTEFKNGTLGESAINFLKGEQDYKNTSGDKQQSFNIGNSRGERNNNPLNMNFAKQRGATLEDGRNARFAKFNTPYEGLERTAWQLRRYYDGLTTGEKLQTVQDIVETWAPKGDGKNDPTGYAKRVAQKLGVSPTDKIDLKNDDVMFALMNAMSKEEIDKPLPYSESLIMAAIKGTGDPTQNALRNIQSFSKQISTPFVAGINGLSNDFLGQSHKLQAQAQTINNKTDISVGDINISTTASTISGVAEDAGDSIAARVYQLVPTMN